jgi:hypothetical protein
MLAAYEDVAWGFQVKEVPVEFKPITNRGEAVRLYREASRRRPDIRWVIVGEGDGPFSVQEQTKTSAQR